MTSKEYQDIISKPKKKSKYNSKATTTEDGYFPSQKELNRWNKLKLKDRAGLITALSRQVRFNLAGVAYISDFVYFDIETKVWIVEDAKGFKTKEYKNKKTLMKNLLGIEIKET